MQISGPFLSLKVEKLVIQFHIGLFVDALTHKESQLVGVLAGSGHSDDPLKHKEKQSGMTNTMPKSVTFTQSGKFDPC